MKKLLLILATCIATTPYLPLHASYESVKSGLALITGTIAGPCTIVASIGASKLAKQKIKTIEVIKEYTGEISEINAKNLVAALKTQKRSKIGLAIGTALSMPHVYFLKKCYDYNENPHEKNAEKALDSLDRDFHDNIEA